MSMSKEDGWEDYFCDTCGKLLGHFYMGFGWERLWGWVRMIRYTLWSTCHSCMFMNKMRLRGRIWMVSTPMVKNDYFQKLWEESQ